MWWTCQFKSIIELFDNFCQNWFDFCTRVRHCAQFSIIQLVRRLWNKKPILRQNTIEILNEKQTKLSFLVKKYKKRLDKERNLFLNCFQIVLKIFFQIASIKISDRPKVDAIFCDQISSYLFLTFGMENWKFLLFSNAFLLIIWLCGVHTSQVMKLKHLATV